MIQTFSSTTKQAVIRLLPLLLIAILLCVARLTVAQSSGLEAAHTVIAQALQEAHNGNLDKTRLVFADYENAWMPVEDALRAKSPDTYLVLEEYAGEAKLALTRGDIKAAETALRFLEAAQMAYIQNAGVTGQAPIQTTSISQLLATLKDAQAQVAVHNFANAATRLHDFQRAWLAIEGEVKTRSPQTYTDTENDLALALSLVEQQSPDASGVLQRMQSQLLPFVQNDVRYAIADAAIILLREGLEALLIIVALVAFLRKSGNANKTGWVWLGTGVGILLSIAVGVGVQIVFHNFVTPNNRELVEGIAGLVAASMLIYMSYWMHSKSSTIAWQRYIQHRSTTALATGSLAGIAVLAFLSIFREGAETALFFVGMASAISISDLLMGLAIGAVGLAVLGFALFKLGVRVPISTFFGIGSALVFYLCFKFVGVGIHALQVAAVLPAHASAALPESGFFGLFPTWETTATQLVMLIVATSVAIITRMQWRKTSQVPNPV